MTVIRLDVEDPELAIRGVTEHYVASVPLVDVGPVGTVWSRLGCPWLVVIRAVTADYINAWDERGKHVLFVGDIEGVDAVTVEDGPALILRVLALLA